MGTRSFKEYLLKNISELIKFMGDNVRKVLEYVDVGVVFRTYAYERI